MFSFCVDPATLDGLQWYACYLTSGKHLLFYRSFLVVIALLLITAPLALALGFAGAVAARSHFAPVSLIGKGYSAMVRGVPDIVFFLFVPLMIDQGLEWMRHKIKCPDWTEPVRRGSDFIVCPEAKLPLASSPPWIHEIYGFTLAVVAFAIVFGAFAANVIYGAMNSVPKAQLETGEAYGMSHGQIFRRILVPQMWTYAIPGLSNLWMILIKATPLLFLLGVQDIVYWARELGASKTSHFDYPHGDWRLWYFLVLLAWYLLLTWISERVLARYTRRLAMGQATLAGEQIRRAA
ncbi:ABC transporter permease [Haematobacter missouriensis]|mgnify:CR=1 FL=1|uniref:ABC transporter permease n=1 Tax=Haematobacter missouriensis TaxID=366616 RepID=A0A212AWY4_9RHOB|nr:ABC transporter permease subunit [Haematobacter missouriensis]KFI34008.1 ABC transporter permease [Haematobacter missouriensis]OWJ78247.1 ABC transporter permease [Haematobacter missouriensis]OWJ85997.1 ABC transporter permease [Haematobacter missouriensis]